MASSDEPPAAAGADQPPPAARPTGPAAGPPARGDHHVDGFHDGFHDRLEQLEQAAIEAEMETGRREETVEEARAGVLRRLGRMTAGFFLCGLGLALLVLPGPGLVVLASGLLLLSVDVPFAARLLEKVRARIPSDADGNVPTHVIVAGVATTICGVAGSLWWTFLR